MLLENSFDFFDCSSDSSSFVTWSYVLERSFVSLKISCFSRSSIVICKLSTISCNSLFFFISPSNFYSSWN